jgi:hypothetical protein
MHLNAMNKKSAFIVDLKGPKKMAQIMGYRTTGVVIVSASFWVVTE